MLSLSRHIIPDVGPLAQVPHATKEEDAMRLDRHLHKQDGLCHRPVVVHEAVANRAPFM